MYMIRLICTWDLSEIVNKSARGWNMKRAIAMVLMFVCIVLVGCAAADYTYQSKAPGVSDISANDAAQIALRHTMEQGNCILLSEDGNTYDFPMLELERRPVHCKATFVSVLKQDAWVISFFPEDLPVLAAAVTVASPSGETIDATFGYTITMQRKWEEEKGIYWFWSNEDKYMFDMLYANPAQNEVHVLPEETDIPLERAEQIACEAVADRYGLPLSGVSSEFLLECNLVSIDGHQRQWQISFRKENSSGDDYDLFYWAYMDAVTGDVVTVDDNFGGLG